MTARHQKALMTSALFALNAWMLSCTGGTPPPPAKGTPAFYWTAAKETFAAGDYVKASDHLEQLAKTDNEYIARAQPWKLVLDTGMAKGYMILADCFERGGFANRTNPTPFRRQMSQFRIHAGQYAVQAAETMFRFREKNKDPEIVLEFTYPTGSAAEIPQLNKISQGILIQEAELEAVERKTTQREVLLMTCRAVGAPDDTAKTQELFKSPPVKVPRATFLMAFAEAFYDLSSLFGPKKLDQPQRLGVLCKEALAILREVPESKKTKDLKAKIEKALKEAKIT
jgi:hypothetical protein